MLFSSQNDEKRLLKGLRAQKPDAQRQLFEQYSGKMMALCHRYAKCREEAEDILQEGFLRVFRKIELYEGTGSFEGWMRRVFTNVAIRHYQKQAKMYLVVGIEEMDVEPSENFVSQHFDAEDMMKMVQQLPDGYRIVFNLYAIEGYSHEEIAKELGISVGTSKSQLSRARQALQKMLEAADSAERRFIINA